MLVTSSGQRVSQNITQRTPDVIRRHFREVLFPQDRFPVGFFKLETRARLVVKK